MYCLRLIKKKISDVDESGKIIYDDFVTATHIKINKDKLYVYDPVSSSSSDDECYKIDTYSHIFINHYIIFEIEELKEAYEKIIQAYSTLSQSSSYHREFDNVISIFELVDTMFAIKESKIINKINENNKAMVDSLLNKKNKQKSNAVEGNYENENKSDESNYENEGIENKEDKG